jgi:hypothetical protein
MVKSPSQAGEQKTRSTPSGRATQARRGIIFPHSEQFTILVSYHGISGCRHVPIAAPVVNHL